MPDLTGFDLSLHIDEEIRRFFGEQTEPVGTVPHAAAATPARTFQERHDAFIAEGLCPACKVEYDEAGFCSICGFDLAQDKPLQTVEMRDDYVPQLPLPLDEFAPAAVTDEAA